jgi:subtilisin family serine protease
MTPLKSLLIFSLLIISPGLKANLSQSFGELNSNAIFQTQWQLAQQRLIQVPLPTFQPPVIAVIDSGVSLINPLLTTHLMRTPIGSRPLSYDFVNKRPFMIDDNGHGTHVSGIVAALAPYSPILALKVLDANGDGQVENVIAAINYAVEQGARVINLSLGAMDLLGQTENSYAQAIGSARAKGVLVVAAAGNESLDNDQWSFFPSGVWDDNVLSVCAVNPLGHLAHFSNYGQWRVHVCAPGQNIISLGHQFTIEPWALQSGTSQAAPMVSALAALLFAIKPELEPFQVRDIIMSTVNVRRELEGTSQTGGVINFDRAIEWVLRI